MKQAKVVGSGILFLIHNFYLRQANQLCHHCPRQYNHRGVKSKNHDINKAAYNKRKWGTTLEQSALLRYSSVVIGWTNKARLLVLIFINKTKPNCSTGQDIIKSPTCSNTNSLGQFEMIAQEDIYFEILGSGDIVRLQPKNFLGDKSGLVNQNDWITTSVTVRGGKFSGKYDAEFNAIDFAKFKQELIPLYDNLKGTATFSGLEGQLELKIAGDGIGHFEVNVIARDQPSLGGQLSFKMEFDQTSIKKIVSQLDVITKRFPIDGDFKTRKEKTAPNN